MGKKWTIIMQISGENNLIMDSISVFNEIGAVGSNPDVNFVILMDGMHIEGELPAEFKYLNNKKLDYPTVYYMEPGTKYVTAKPKKVFEEYDNLADKKNLGAILKYIKDEYKTEQYGYIYKGHGGAGTGDVTNGSFISQLVAIKRDEYKPDGSVDIKKVEERIIESLVPEEWALDGTFFLDDNEKHPRSILAIYYKGTGEVLTYVQQSEVLREVFGKRGLDFILLDCCWGMMLENVHVFKDCTQYFIASPDECPALGLGYTSLCSFITERAKIKPSEMAKMLVAVYYTIRYQDYDDPADPTYKNMGVSMTCVDCNAIEDIIVPKLTKFCSEIIDDIKNFTPIMLAAANTCKDYTYSNPYVYKMYNLDLTWFLENIIFQISKSHKKFDTINDLAFELIRDLNLYLITGYLGNNYDRTTPGEKAIGGKGITITLPKKENYYNNGSLVKPGSKIEFYSITNWRSMLLKFYQNLSDKQTNIDLSPYLKNIQVIQELSVAKLNDSPRIKDLSSSIISNFRTKTFNADWYEDFLDLNSFYSAPEIQSNAAFKNIISSKSFEMNDIDNVYSLDIEPEWKKTAD